MTSPAVGTGIVAFIEARLAEREAEVARLRELGDRVGNAYGHDRSPEAEMNLGDLAYFALHKQADRLIAEVAKDRAILAYHYPFAIPPGHCDADNEVYPCQTVRLLAAIDADHAAYRPEWKPVAG